jgi:hypothetical protein
MSRATLYVRFPDGEVRFGLYNGTSDIAWSPLYATQGEAWDVYTAEPWPDGTTEGTAVDVATNYGNGFWWRGVATRDALLSPLDPWQDAEIVVDELPDWAIAEWRP